MMFTRALSLLAAASPAIAFKVHTKIVTSSDGAKIYAEAIGYETILHALPHILTAIAMVRDKNQPHVLLLHGLQLCGAVFDNLFADQKLVSSAYIV